MNYENYVVNILCPNRQDFTKYTLLDVCSVSVVLEEININNFIKKLKTFPKFESICESNMFKIACKNGYAIGKTFDEDDYNLAVEEYSKELKYCQNQFDADLFEENGVSNNPKAKLLLEKCFNICGHKRDYEIVEMFEEFVDLIKN
jgi:hypothetical protein